LYHKESRLMRQALHRKVYRKMCGTGGPSIT
jgi:hypothetical protein